VRTLGLVPAALLAGLAVVAAQTPPSGPAVASPADRPFRAGIDVVSITATVVNASGGYVSGLGRDDFEVYEDGQPQPITHFTGERVPVSLGLLLDVSDSMFGDRIKDARAAVERFLLALLKPTDMYFLMSFNHQPRTLTPWTTDPATVRAALAAIRPSGGTSIYDAVMTALPMMEQRTRERAAIVIISDGSDTTSDTTLRDLRSALLRADSFVYAVAIDSPKRQPINTRVNPEALGEVTNPTGGHTAVVQDAAGLDAATAKIAEELNSQYVLGYSSPHPGDGKYHSIRVRVGNGAYRVRARNGYVATAPTKSRK
jgi:Ca-activated chloride channel family protein